MIKFKKGEMVWQFGRCSYETGQVFFRLLKVESWGAAHATLSHANADGKMIKQRIYVSRANVAPGSDHFFAATEGFNPEAKALELSVDLIADTLELYRGKVGHPAYYQPSCIAKVEALEKEAPSFKNLTR